jgi:hypothetical protein
MSEIDWKSELRKAERQFDGLPPEPTAEELRGWRLDAEREQRRRDELNGAAGAWTRLSLVIALTVGLYFWPYARTCGAGLYGLLGAQLAVVIGGLWVAVYSWRRRTARAHGAALVLALVGSALIAAEMLPRIGYARPDASRPSRMSCAS